jgi:saccharopine dehydrogenase (NAD+, L-glutamate forming)
MTDSRREYDLVVFGATGFTGGMVAEYLARNAPDDLRWAIAGRSQSKLDTVKTRLIALNERFRSLPTLQASVDDPGSLQRMAASTRVLITTVGPFIDYGEPVVRACVEQGTDYIDSTGEPHFMSLLLARYSAPAAARGVRLVPSCGFDSIPADLGAFFTVQQLPPDQPIELAGYMSLDAKFSGGTERSAILSFASPREPIDVPQRKPSKGRRVGPGVAKIERRPELQRWSSPLPTIDGPLVLRSATALDRYGPDFTYVHNALHPSLFVMVAAAVFFGTLAFMAKFPALRAVLLKGAKQSGEGPTTEQMARSWFKLHFIAKCAGKILQTEVSGGDPGYVETSKMLAESGMCLAQDRDVLPPRAGVLTPAEAMGEQLLARLQRAGLTFRVT